MPRMSFRTTARTYRISLTRSLPIAAVLLCFLLAGCLFIPGMFQAKLDVRQNGTFSFQYRGEIRFLSPDMAEYDTVDATWSDDMANCWEGDSNAPAPCSEAEIADQRKEFDFEQADNRAAAERIAGVFGFNPIDRHASEAFAKQMEAYPGWKSVTYQGKGIFLVDYAIEGTLDRDFIFPAFPKAKVSVPFLTLRKRGDGAIEMEAGGLAAEVLQHLTEKKPKRDWDPHELSLFLGTRGTLELTTNARLEETSGERTSTKGQHASRWAVVPGESPIPTAMISLD